MKKNKNRVLLSALMLSILSCTFLCALVLYNNNQMTLEANFPEDVILKPLLSETEQAEFYDKYSKAVFTIVDVCDDDECVYSAENSKENRLIGSGFIIHESGIALTAAHVINGKHPSYDLRAKLFDGTLVEIVLNFSDLPFKYISGDRAVIQLERREKPYPYLETEPAENAAVGDDVYLIAAPQGKSYFTAGNIAKHSSHNSKITTTALSNPGNSGGALITRDGKAIGILVESMRQTITDLKLLKPSERIEYRYVSASEPVYILSDEDIKLYTVIYQALLDGIITDDCIPADRLDRDIYYTILGILEAEGLVILTEDGEYILPDES